MKARGNTARTYAPALPAEGIQHFRLVEVLLERARNMGRRPRRARTLASIIAATAQEMERSGIDGLTVAKIATAAGLAHGTFYLYFQNRLEAAMAVRRFFDAAMRRFRPRSAGRLPVFAAIMRMNRFYVRSYAENADLLRALQLLPHTQPEYARRRDRINNAWSATVLHDLNRQSRNHGSEHTRPLQMLLIRSAISMVDETLREIYVHRSSTLRHLIADDEDVALAISIAWYRILHGADPPESELASAVASGRPSARLPRVPPN
jgi:AcrR family transcriptional regulator